MKFLRLFLFSALCLALPQGFKRECKIPPPFEQVVFGMETAPPDDRVLAALNQPFSYLTHGNQSTVFASQDGNYVLKVFRYSRPRFPFVHRLKSWAAKLQGKKPKDDLFTKLHKTLHAAHIACTEAKEYTQAVFCHLNPTHGELPKISLPLDRCRFVLQKKVSPFKETLLAARGNPEQMHRLIDSVLSLIVERSALGIRNSDPNLAPNFGFLEGRAVEIDFGNYRRGEQRAEEIRNYRVRLEHWLSKNAPEYTDYLRGKGAIEYAPQNENTAKLHRS